MRQMNSKLAVVTLCGVAALVGFAPVAQAVGAKVAHFNLNGPLVEKPQGNMGFSLGIEPKSLKELIERIDKAGKDSAIRAILITYENPAMGLAQVEELRQALKDSGKPVYVHADSYTTGTYLLSTGASHISVTPTGDVWMMGMYAEAPYLKRLLDKISVSADFVHIGDFKSAGEPLYRDGPSEAAAENMNWLLDGLYGSMVKIVADSRYGGNEEKVKEIIDKGPYTAEQALELGLVDSVQHRQDLTATLKAKYGDDLTFVGNYGAGGGPDIDFSNPFSLFKIFGELMSGESKSSKTSIAVVYVEGAIMPGSDQPSPFGGSSGAMSTTIRKALDDAAADSSVKAVVLRVDSPGGSALASEIIFDAVKRVQAAGKPVVVSMGNVAGSGGYYVSCGADHIIADPTTITASIGVVGGKIVTTEMWDSVGITWHEYQRGESADLFSSARKWDEGEREKILTWMTGIYDIFKGHITKHRGDKLTKPLDEMAGGRVFTGRQALDLGLVDQLGTFADAVDKAADMASVADYELRVLPKPKNLFDFLREGMGDQEQRRVQVTTGAADLFAPASPLVNAVLPMLERLDPQRSRLLMQALTRLSLLHKERVILMMPQDILIRME